MKPLQFGDLASKAAAIAAAKAEARRRKTFERRVTLAMRHAVTYTRAELVKRYGSDAATEAHRRMEATQQP